MIGLAVVRSTLTSLWLVAGAVAAPEVAAARESAASDYQTRAITRSDGPVRVSASVHSAEESRAACGVPLEVGWYQHSELRGCGNDAIDAHFDRMAFANPVPPGQTCSGLLCATPQPVTRLLNVDLWGNCKLVTFSLLLDVLRCESVRRTRGLLAADGSRMSPYGEEPRAIADSSQYFTDGVRAVSFFSVRPLTFADVRRLDWEPFLERSEANDGMGPAR